MNSTALNTTNVILNTILRQEIVDFGESGYPEEVVGFLLGITEYDKIMLHHLLPVENQLGVEARHHRYVINSADWSRAEVEAKRLHLDIVGVFHTHPDHPAKPSIVDLEFALPNLAYIIASVHQHNVVDMRVWELREDRAQFDECLTQIIDYAF